MFEITVPAGLAQGCDVEWYNKKESHNTPGDGLQPAKARTATDEFRLHFYKRRSYNAETILYSCSLTMAASPKHHLVFACLGFVWVRQSFLAFVVVDIMRAFVFGRRKLMRPAGFGIQTQRFEL